MGVFFSERMIFVELTELLNHIKELFAVENTIELTEKLKQVTTENLFEYHQGFVDIVNDLKTDWLQMIYQYYEADREDKKQDYTPKSIGVLLCQLLGKCHKVYDQCAGSGALTIQYWAENRNTEFVCEELDENVIPYLLFNLSVRNISGYVIQKDILKNEVYQAYRLDKNGTFSRVMRIEPFEVDYKKIDGAISNPPYNIKWTIPDFATFDNRFLMYGIPPANNANYAFMLNALDKADRCAFILPNAVLTSDKVELNIRKAMIENNVIDAVVTLPDKMFTSTSIPTCIIVLDKHRQDNKIHMVDMQKECTKEIREQKGQYGSASHTNRVYKREFNVFSYDNIKKCIDTMKAQEAVEGFYALVPTNEIKNAGFRLTPSTYITNKSSSTHRPLQDIVKDINAYTRDKNVAKITMNESLAKAIGLYDVYLIQEKQNENMRGWNEQMKKFGIQIEEEHFIALSKKKNEIKIEQQDKEITAEVIMQVISSWKAHIVYLNNKQNALVGELRDAMITELFSGNMEL